jgi:hypothetical protein
MMLPRVMLKTLAALWKFWEILVNSRKNNFLNHEMSPGISGAFFIQVR